MVTQALIPAAGRGARLDRPNTAKPLVTVGGRPLLLGVLQQLDAAGIEKAVVVVGFKGREIERQLTNHPSLDLEVTFVNHPDWEQGLASSILAGQDELNRAPFLLAMADHCYEQALIGDVMNQQLGDDAGVMVIDGGLDDVYDLAAAVKVCVDDDRVVGADRGLDEADGADVGLFLFTPTIFEELEAAVAVDPSASLTDGVHRLAEKGKLRAQSSRGRSWHDIDTPPALIRAEMEYRNRRRKEAVTKPKFGPAGAVETYAYEFTTGKPEETDVYVQRGFVRNPDRIQLIPDESASSPIYVFTDTRVNELYGDDFVGGLDAMGYDVRRVVMAEGEESKTIENYTEIVDHVLGEGIDERSVLVSLGGGAVCNVCGFVASTLYRGIGLVHVPTTLMAQCDAAISHKQGINGTRGKNLVGAYYAPKAIAVDVEVLATLEDWLIPDGLSEVVKHALGQDREYLDYLLDYDGTIDNPDFLEFVVRRNIELKCELMAIDPKELREGMVLQYGHTVGHPVEYLSGYDLNHGQSVGIGMMVAARVARLLGACGDDMIDLHREVIEKYELPTAIPRGLDVDDIMATLRYNKRYLAEGTRMALIDEPGRIWKVEDDYAIPVPDEVLREAINASFE